MCFLWLGACAEPGAGGARDSQWADLAPGPPTHCGQTRRGTVMRRVLRKARQFGTEKADIRATRIGGTGMRAAGIRVAGIGAVGTGISLAAASLVAIAAPANAATAPDSFAQTNLIAS